MFNPSRIFKIEVMEAILWLVERAYLFSTHPVHGFFWQYVLGPGSGETFLIWALATDRG